MGMIGGSAPGSVRPSAQQLVNSDDIFGTADRSAGPRRITLTPYGYQLNGTLIPNPDWHPEVGEPFSMVDHTGAPTGTFRYMGQPPGAGPSATQATGLPGLLARLFGRGG